MDAFIKLLKSPRNYYFYDVNKNTLVEITKECYDYLDGKGSIEVCQDEIETLKEKGFLSNNHTKELKHPNQDNVKEILDFEMESLILQVTQACNLCCSYCPFANSTNDSKHRTHSSKYMSWETAKSAIDFVADHSKKSNKIVVSFYGGEPLISFPLIKKCVEYAEEVFDGKDIDYSLTTNATLLNEEMINFFIEHGVGVAFSTDGPKVIHDKNRKRIDGSPTYDTVMDWLHKYASMIPNGYLNQMLAINMVIDPEDDFRIIDEWVNNEIPGSVAVSAGLYEDDELENKKRISDDNFNECLQYLMALELVNYLGIIDDVPKSKIADNYAKQLMSKYVELKSEEFPLPQMGIPNGPCIPGKKNLFVNVDGDFYPCEKVNERSKAVKMGSLSEDFDYENIISQMNIAQLTPDECINCWAQRHCDICQKYIVEGDYFSAQKKLSLCGGTKSLFEQILLTSILMKESSTVYKKVTDV